MSLASHQCQSWKKFTRLLALVLFGLAELGHGTAVGTGKEAIGNGHHIREPFGFRTDMLFTMEDTSSFGAGGGD